MRHLHSVRIFFRYLLRALVLLTVFLASALTAMRFAIHGREVAVPKLVGMKPADAERTATSNGLLFTVESRFYSSEVPEGRVLTQQPPPGQKVRRGWQVRVAESLGPQKVTIPDVVGQSARAAEINLTRRGLEVGTVSTIHMPGAPADQIIGQSPAPQATGITSPKVNLLVAATDEGENAIVMPDLVGATIDHASSVIAGAGLKFGEVKTVAKTTGAKTAVVVRHTPGAGQKVQPGVTVNLDVQR